MSNNNLIEREAEKFGDNGWEIEISENIILKKNGKICGHVFVIEGDFETNNIALFCNSLEKFTKLLPKIDTSMKEDKITVLAWHKPGITSYEICLSGEYIKTIHIPISYYEYRNFCE